MAIAPCKMLRHMVFIRRGRGRVTTETVRDIQLIISKCPSSTSTLTIAYEFGIEKCMLPLGLLKRFGILCKQQQNPVYKSNHWHCYRLGSVQVLRNVYLVQGDSKVTHTLIDFTLFCEVFHILMLWKIRNSLPGTP